MPGRKFVAGEGCMIPGVKEKYGHLWETKIPDDESTKSHTRLKRGERDWRAYFRMKKELSADKYTRWVHEVILAPVEPIPAGATGDWPKASKKIQKDPNR